MNLIKNLIDLHLIMTSLQPVIDLQGRACPTIVIRVQAVHISNISRAQTDMSDSCQYLAMLKAELKKEESVENAGVWVLAFHTTKPHVRHMGHDACVKIMLLQFTGVHKFII